MTLTAVLFAGGESRRMGVDKATLMIADEPLWARQLRTLRELRPDKILISARVKPEWCPLDIDVQLDEPPSRGPLSGLAAALKKMQTTHLLALAVDLPNMTAGHLQKVWAAAHARGGVLPVGEEKCEPLCAIYPRTAMETVERALLGNDFSLRNVIRYLMDEGAMERFSISNSEREFYLNANTPDDLNSAWMRGM